MTVSMPSIPTVSLAPTLLCEGSLSMDLYAENLIEEFRQMPEAIRWDTISPSPVASASKVKRYLLRNLSFPLLVRRAAKKGGILHVLDHSNGHLCRHHPRSVATCHDIAEYRETALNSRQLNHWKWRVEGLKQAQRVIAISNNTRTDLIELLGIPADRIDVAHYGVDPLFRPWDREEIAARFPELDSAKLKILHIGSNIQRKNIPVLIRALGLLKQRHIDFSFVKIGGQFPADQLAMIQKAGIQDHIVFLGNRTTEELPMIYSLCDIFVFPSTYEGFGRPILEAQACGVPTILAESSCLPEVGGKGALYFAPQEEEALASRILELENPETRSRLIAAGFANASSYTWRSHAEKVLGTYQKVS